MGDPASMTMGIGIALGVALVVVLLVLATFTIRRRSTSAPESKKDTAKAKAEPAAAPAKAAASTPDWANDPPPPAAPDEVLAVDPILPESLGDGELSDRFSDDDEDEDMVTVQASPEELAKMLAEIRGRNTD